jgi:hypothetical protein
MTWPELVVDLAAFAGELATITFQFESDVGISGTLGWQVDNVHLFSESLDPNGNGIPDDCELPPIPAVSEWGLVMMTLLVLAAGTIVFRRLSAATV